tara:strand:+ start:5299 stop:6168 length:870 start_codon:yes stop_codon:yes gene_type:complete
MEFINGYTVKPVGIRPDGIVLFTDGTNNDLMVNQATCEAYGYTFDIDSGSCRAFDYNSNIGKTIENINNKNNGVGNTFEVGSINVQVNGIKNTTKGYNTNCFINGANNKIQSGVDNATVLGIGGTAESNGELVIGGGLNTIGSGSDISNADRKMSIVALSGRTTDSTTTNLTVNGDGSTFIGVKNNSILGFEMYITRLETGGSAGTAGKYSYANIKGVVQIDNAYSMAFIVGFTRNIGKIGVNGTKAMVDTSTTDVKSISIAVSDRNNVTNIWSATVYIHELISTNITF